MLQWLQLAVIAFYLLHAVGFMQGSLFVISSSSTAYQAAAMASSAYVNKLRSGSVMAGDDVLC